MSSSESDDDGDDIASSERKKIFDRTFSLCMIVRDTPLFIRLMDENPDIDPFYIDPLYITVDLQVSIFEQACTVQGVDGSVIKKCLERGHKNRKSFYKGVKSCLYHDNRKAGLALFSDRSWDIFKKIVFHDYEDYNAFEYSYYMNHTWFVKKGMFDDFPGVVDYYRKNHPDFQIVVNPTKAIFDSGLDIGEPEVYSSVLYAQVIFVCDDLLKVIPVPNAKANPKGKYASRSRFFNIAKKMPMELQMILCNRVYGLSNSFIPSKFSEPAFKHLTSLYLEKK